MGCQRRGGRGEGDHTQPPSHHLPTPLRIRLGQQSRWIVWLQRRRHAPPSPVRHHRPRGPGTECPDGCGQRRAELRLAVARPVAARCQVATDVAHHLLIRAPGNLVPLSRLIPAVLPLRIISRLPGRASLRASQRIPCDRVLGRTHGGSNATTRCMAQRIDVDQSWQVRRPTPFEGWIVGSFGSPGFGGTPTSGHNFQNPPDSHEAAANTCPASSAAQARRASTGRPTHLYRDHGQHGR
jgi:hypothetical protein